MKTRVKKFYEDHKDKIAQHSGYVIGTVIGTYAVVAYCDYKFKPVGATEYEIQETGERVLAIQQRTGKITNLRRKI